MIQHLEAAVTRMPNGIVLYHYPTTQFKTVTMMLCLHQRLGDDAARTAVLPFLLRRGCRGFPSLRDLARRLEELYGAALEPGVWKLGERQVAVWELELAEERFVPDPGDLLGQGMELLRQLLTEPATQDGAFRADYLAGERENLIRRVQSLANDKRAYAIFRLGEEMCRGEAFARHQYGRVEELAALEPHELWGYYQHILRENPLDLFVVGGGEPEDLARRARTVLDFPRTGGVTLGTTPLGNAPAAPREVVEEQQVHQAKLCLGFRTATTYADPAYTALAVANGILGAFPHSKLFREVRERASLAYYANSRLEPTKGLLIVSAGINAADYPRSREIILQQLAAVQAGDFTGEELENTRRAMERGILASEDVPEQKIRDAVVGLVNGRLEGVAERLARLRDVTAEQVVEASRRIRLDTVYLLTGKGVA
ncbi:MAG: pitrilysin family protein [Thermaerobacter sp.]|nr:pitrilysin family protein [Thermaerobacter sp.]